MFLKVRTRKYKNECGKCHVCESLKNLMKESLLRSDRQLVREYRLIHRQQIMGEKLKYQERKLESLDSQKICGISRVQSLIFDSMTKKSTALPSLSNTAQFKHETFTNNVMGCICHASKETKFYTSFGCVDSGSSYMIHCLLTEIENVVKECKHKHVPLPEKWYIQIDGASDNAAKYVLASLEHLQSQGLSGIIEVWRLPVGHTHEVVLFTTLKSYIIDLYFRLELIIFFTILNVGHRFAIRSNI